MENSREEYKIVYQRISYYKNNSIDISFHNYLDSVIVEVSKSAKRPEEFLAELDANYQKYLSVIAEKNKAVKEESNKKLEYSLGVGVLSVFGIAFILYGIFSFGREYITDVVLMCILYVLAVGVVAFSELVLAKKHNSTSQLITCVGFSLAYFTTYYSYANKEIFGPVVAAILAAVISVLAMILNRFKNSEFIEIVAGLGVACVALPFVRGESELTFVIFGGVIAFVNLALYITGRKQTINVSKVIRTITMIIAGLCMTLSFDFVMISFWYKGGLCFVYALIFAIAYMLYDEVAPVKYTCLAGMSIFCLGLLNSKVDEGAYIAAILAVGLISLMLFWYYRFTENKWLGYIVFMSFMTLHAVAAEDDTISILLIFGILLVSKLMIYRDVKALDIFDCVITGFSLLMMLYAYKNPLVYTIAVVAVMGCFIAKKYRMYHVVFTCITMVCFSFLNDALWLSISFMVVALLLIGYGCYINSFEVRLSGLILSLIVCLKVSLFDFRKADDFRRLIVFIVVGAIAIGISILYLQLEKREKLQQMNAANGVLLTDTNVAYNNIEESADSSVEERIENSTEDTGSEAGKSEGEYIDE